MYYLEEQIISLRREYHFIGQLWKGAHGSILQLLNFKFCNLDELIKY